MRPLHSTTQTTKQYSLTYYSTSNTKHKLIQNTNYHNCYHHSISLTSYSIIVVHQISITITKQPATMTHTSNKSQAVSFSEYSELYLFPVVEQDISTTWYSSQDKQGFRRSIAASIRGVSREIEELPAGTPMTQEQLISCLGIDKFITMGVATSAAIARRAHIDAVLSEQMRQRQNGICDIDMLSNVSLMGSLRTNDRASRLARGYAALLLDEED
jgi:hypothetical protein